MSASAPAPAGRGTRPCSARSRRAGSASRRRRSACSSGDSARDVPGFGAVASRSAMMVGGAIAQYRRRRDREGQARRRHAAAGGRSRGRIRDGKFSVKNREVSLFEVAERAAELKRRASSRKASTRKASIKVPPSFPERLPRRRGRDRSGDRRARDRQLCGGRRLRQRARRHHRHGADARRRGAGAWPGADRGHGLRRRRPARVRLVHGLRLPRAHDVPAMKVEHHAGRLPHQSARRQGHRRGRHHRRAAGADQRHSRRAAEGRAARHAGDAGTHLAGAAGRLGVTMARRARSSRLVMVCQCFISPASQSWRRRATVRHDVEVLLVEASRRLGRLQRLIHRGEQRFQHRLRRRRRREQRRSRRWCRRRRKPTSFMVGMFGYSVSRVRLTTANAPQLAGLHLSRRWKRR